jgi:hypothetical protein
VGTPELYDRAHTLVCVRTPDAMAPTHAGQILIGITCCWHWTSSSTLTRR